MISHTETRLGDILRVLKTPAWADTSYPAVGELVRVVFADEQFLDIETRRGVRFSGPWDVSVMVLEPTEWRGEFPAVAQPA